MKESNNVKMTMYGGAIVFLDKNASIYAGKKGFINQKTNFYTQHNNMLKKAGEAGVILRGITSLKDEAKQVLADDCSMYCGFGFIKLDELGMHDVTEQLFTNASDYTHVSDSEAGVRAENMHKLLEANLTLITDDYLTALQLTEMQATIDNFIATKGTSTSEHTAGPVATKDFNDSFAPVDAAIASMLTMAKAFKKTEPDFYNELIAVTTVPTAHVLHTYAVITAIAKVSGAPIAVATGEITKLNKSGKANALGVIKLERVRHGVQQIVVAAPGFKTVTINAAIQSGRQNDFKVEMEAE